MMRQHSKVVHASSGDSDNLRASRVQERMANSISVEWNNKRVPQTAMVRNPFLQRLISREMLLRRPGNHPEKSQRAIRQHHFPKQVTAEPTQKRPQSKLRLPLHQHPARHLANTVVYSSKS
jgi:hypothetical protein